MSTKIVLAVLLTGLGAVAIMLLAFPPRQPPPQPPPPTEAAEAPQGSQSASEANTNANPAFPLAPAAAKAQATAPGADDPRSAAAILADLQSPDKEVRAQAIERAKQLEDRSIVARLQEIADRTEDAQERAAALAAIDFINLPSLTAFQAAGGSNRPPVRLPKPGAPGP